MKLTANQRKALFEMIMRSRVNDKFMPATVNSLVKLKYAETVYGVASFGRYFRITGAGRAALEGREVKSPWQDPSIFDDAEGRN